MPVENALRDKLVVNSSMESKSPRVSSPRSAAQSRVALESAATTADARLVMYRGSGGNSVRGGTAAMPW